MTDEPANTPMIEPELRNIDIHVAMIVGIRRSDIEASESALRP